MESRTSRVHNVTMRIESSVTSLSWIPSEAVRGATRVAFDAGFTHYDDPPPDVIEDLEALRKADRFRFANVLSAWIEVDGNGQGDRTTATQGEARWAPPPPGWPGSSGSSKRWPSPTSSSPPRSGRAGSGSPRRPGGRTGLPAPRRVRRRPFIQWQAPLVWSTLSLTLHADGTRSSRSSGPAVSPGTGSSTARAAWRPSPG